MVAALILKTKAHDAGDDEDARLLVDADLAILGANESIYRTYAENIRREHDWVPETEFIIGRRQVLERFLAKPRIFLALTNLEDMARSNIAAEIERLGRKCV